MLLEVFRALYGLLELTAPGTVAGMALGRRPDDRLRVTIRILGARHLVQAAVTLTNARWHTAGGIVDATHALSMLGLAALDARRRRAALVNAAIAALFAAGELR